MEIGSKLVNIGKIKTYYLEAGVGDQVVMLVHGGGLDNASLSWELLIPVFTKNTQVIAPDFPGYGQSDKPDVVFDLAFMENSFRNS
jgi:pimeloyl-ACP methyl ester carboxylesterase